MMKHLIQFNVGNIYYGESPKPDKVLYLCSVSRPELEEAFQVGTKKVGVDIIQHHNSPKYVMEKVLKATGEFFELLDGCSVIPDELERWFRIEQEIDQDLGEVTYADYDTNGFSWLYMTVAVLGNPKIQFQFVPPDPIELHCPELQE
jgi:hypothetical protein